MNNIICITHTGIGHLCHSSYYKQFFSLKLTPAFQNQFLTTAYIFKFNFDWRTERKPHFCSTAKYSLNSPFPNPTLYIWMAFPFFFIITCMLTYDGREARRALSEFCWAAAALSAARSLPGAFLSAKGLSVAFSSGSESNLSVLL